MPFGIDHAPAHGGELDHEVGLVLPEGRALGGFEDLEDAELDPQPREG